MCIHFFLGGCSRFLNENNQLEKEQYRTHITGVKRVAKFSRNCISPFLNFLVFECKLAFCFCDTVDEEINLKGGKIYFWLSFSGFSQWLASHLGACGEAEHHGSRNMW
jgi:hypothetical protein